MLAFGHVYILLIEYVPGMSWVGRLCVTVVDLGVNVSERLSRLEH